MMYRRVARLSGIALLCTLSACKSNETPATTSPPAQPPKHAEPAKELGTWYHAKLIYSGVGELPFFMHLPSRGTPGKAKMVNGEEITEFEVQWKQDEVSMTGPWNYVSLIEAQVTRTGELKGTWTRDTPLWGEVVRDFVAVPIDKPDPTKRFPDDGLPPAVDVGGIWEFEFAAHEEGKGILEQGPDGVVRGYIKPGQLGDIRFLAGNVHGSKLSVSHFNGNAANLVLADISADGTTMTGLMSMQNVWNEKFTAKKVDDYKFVDKVRVKKGAKSVSLPGLDKYRGKPTLAIIFATWCSSCNDAAPYLNELYANYHPKGLEVYSVAYDLSADEKANLAELDAFRKKYNVPWEMTQVPCTPDTWKDVMPAELEGWDGLPIMLLVRPDGSVQTAFGGWFGPATGADGQKRQKWFESAIDALVAEAKG